MDLRASMKAKNQPYMREHSMHIRAMSKHGHDRVEEDPIIARDAPSRAMIVVTCRNRQRKLQHAWSRWTHNTGVIHNYLQDVISILSRPIASTAYRTELEVEVFFKWVMQDYAVDTTGIAFALFMCNSKHRIVRVIQRTRLDIYQPGEHIVLQQTVPQPEDGLFTILHGAVDIVILPRESDVVTRLHDARKLNDNDEINRLLAENGVVADTLSVGAGFGELSALTKVRRAASIVAGEAEGAGVMVVTTQDLQGCLDKRRNASSYGAASAEVMDFLRQTGLVHKAAITDVMQVAASITKKVLPSGTLLYKQGDQVDKVFIVLSGEIILDTGEFESSTGAEGNLFQDATPSNCYTLSTGSILGDEGMVGFERKYDASAVVLSEYAVMFEMVGFAIDFLGGRLGVEKFSALLYKDKPGNAKVCDTVLSQIVIHNTFNSLRKVISMQTPFRGVNRPVFKEGNARFVVNKKSEVENRKPPKTPLVAKEGEQVRQQPSSADVSAQDKMSSVPPCSSAILNMDKVLPRGPGAGAKGKKKKVITVDLHPGGASAEGFRVLPTAAMHHLHVIRQSLKQREMTAVRNVTQSMVWNKDKMKRDQAGALRPSQQKTGTAQSAQQHRDKEIYKRAVNHYTRRKDRECEENAKKRESNAFQDSQALSVTEGSDIFLYTTNHAMAEIDSQCEDKADFRRCFSSTSSFAFSLNDGTETKLEQYHAMLARNPSSSLNNGQRRMTRMPSLGHSPSQSPPKRRPTTAPFTTKNVHAHSATTTPIDAAFQESLPIPATSTRVPQSANPRLLRQHSSGSFARVTTAHTSGVERRESVRRPTRVFRKTLMIGMPGDHSPLPLREYNEKSGETCKTQAEKEYDFKRRKFLDIAEEHSRPRDEVVRGVYANTGPKKDIPRTSASGRSFLQVHQTQQSLLSSSFRETNGRELLRKASQQLEEGEDESSVSSRKASLSDFVVDKSTGKLTVQGKRGIKAWNLTASDISEVQQKEFERARVLDKWQELLDVEPTTSSHQRGRCKAVMTSEHRCNTERDRIKDESEIALLCQPGVTQDTRDLLRWKQYCAKKVLDTKNGPLRSMPTLAKQGSKAYLGRKMVVNAPVRPRTSGP